MKILQIFQENENRVHLIQLVVPEKTAGFSPSRNTPQAFPHVKLDQNKWATSLSSSCGRLTPSMETVECTKGRDFITIDRGS